MIRTSIFDGETMRIERDSLGEKKVPKDSYYGIHTQRAIENFPLTGQKMHPALIHALGFVKKAAVEANIETGAISEDIGEVIIKAAEEVGEGKWDEYFVVDALQGGAGTSANMNANEVIANRAIEILGGEKGDYALVHPLEHVNKSQSTNDVFPTAVRIAAIMLLKELEPSVANLQSALQDKEREFASIVKVGRTQLQDAVPITLGQEFSAYAQAIGRDRWRLYKVEERLRQVNIGGTAVGTGINAERKYIYLVTEKLRDITGIGLARAENLIDLTQNTDVFVEVSGFLKACAVNLSKIASDIRLMASGPLAGIGEIGLVPLQAGSSIMPGKVNPIIPEAVNQAAYQVMAYDMAITLAAQAGQFELNAFMPLISHNLLGSLSLLKNAIDIFTVKCIMGIEAKPERCRELLEKSNVAITALVPYIGYDRAAEITKAALQSGKDLREEIRSSDIMTEEEMEKLFSPQGLTRPGVIKLKKNE